MTGTGDAKGVVPAKTLVIGGARSGKSRHAEALALRTGLEPVYVATATAWDAEMEDRIGRHRDGRAGAGWRTLEAPLALVEVLRREAVPGRVLLVDCLTLWLSNVMLGDQDTGRECSALVSALPDLAAPIVFVSNEVGWGIVPETKLGRDFRDAQGLLNQAMAQACDSVLLVAAGLPMVLKG